jgi:hypothetical protein
MEMKTFLRRPFYIEAVEITADNIEEIAKMVGELKHNENGPYIQVDRNILPNMHQVYIGFFMTKMGKNVRCYSPELFNEQFTPKTGPIDDWVLFLNKDLKPKADANGR